MKKIILCSLITLFSMSLFAQEDTSDVDQNPSNEVKLNALFMVIGAFDVTYERLLNEESGVGLEVFIPFDSDIKDDINYYVSPYYRLYFGEKYAAGFFLEGFGMLSSVNNTYLEFSDEFDSSPLIKEETRTDFALGIGLGGKWVTNNGFVGELSLGVGRNFGNSDNGDDAVAKLGITVGYRF